MRIFSGIQPTNEIHIGNYLGALKQWVALQETNECVYCIVDWHAITVPYDPSTLATKIREVAGIYLAAGLDPKKSVIFVQSQVKEHAELAWLLNTTTALGDLQRMTQFKDKSAKFAKNINAGLLNYPVLMAADILLYQAEAVPVGEDQKQHVELTREIGRRFNSQFGPIFKLPKAQVPKQGARVMSLTEPDRKMSKSDPAPSRISLFDEPEIIRKKIASATTDSGQEIKYDPEHKPGIANLLTIYSLFSDQDVKSVEKTLAGLSYQEFKQRLSDLLIDKLTPFRQKKAELNQNPDFVDAILEQGAQKSRDMAAPTIQQVRTAMGLK